MGIPELRPLDSLARVVARALTVGILACCIVVLTGLVTLSPVVLRSLYTDQNDWSRLADIGQTYGIASALLAGLALGGVGVSLAIQYAQFRHARLRAYRSDTREIVKLAMEHPEYAQCWGRRLAPEHVDERLFCYANFIVLNWSTGWEDRLLDERQVREYVGHFFESEVARMFWERHGDWHAPKRAWGRRARFVAIVDEEYLRALKLGPPARRFQSENDAGPVGTLR